MDDLFSANDNLEHIHLPDGDLSYLHHLDLGRPDESILDELKRTVPWRAESIVVWGKKHLQPRLIAWYGDKDFNYTYSGISLQPLEWTPTLLDLKNRIESIVGLEFNSVLINFYRDNNDSIGFHSDDEKELGPHPVIASLSLGEERTFILKHKRNSAVKPLKIKLASGSLLVMRGETQHNWKHGIEKERQKCGPRINLTFRRIYKGIS
ncbi:MAG: alpha-ketoglutarate-dependent dioxygenase AlkB [Herbaspirillum sp.]